MRTSGPDRSATRGASGQFATTHWSIVLDAGRPQSPRYQESLTALYRTYWPPLYAYLRRRGYDASKAEDLTQALFADLLERQDLRLADPQRGRFRSFLLTCLKHFVANEHERARAQKRGGGQAVLPFDFDNAESRYTLEPSHDVTPEKLFDRRWALTVLERVTARLRDEMAKSGKAEQFEQLSPCLAQAHERGQYQAVATALGLREGAVRVAVHRMRRRYRDLLREEIAQTVADCADVDGEIRDLMAALAT